jgi:hypothetical protein
VRAGGKIHLFHRMLEITGRLGIKLAMFADKTRRHRRVRRHFRIPEPGMLDRSRGNDTLADCRRFLPRRAGGKFTEIDKRNLNMKIDAVQQRPRNALAVILDLPGIAPALPFTISIVAARAGICFQEITKRR